jgi:hypothetical protein
MYAGFLPMLPVVVFMDGNVKKTDQLHLDCLGFAHTNFYIYGNIKKVVILKL